MSILVKQSSGNGSNTMSVTFAAGTIPAGAGIVVFIQTDNWNASLPTFTVNDTQGNVYSFLTSTNAGSSNRQIMAFVAANAVGGYAFGATTVTATTGAAGSSNGNLYVICFNNISAVDHFAAASANNTSNQSVTVQNTFANELVVFFYWSLTSILGGGPPVLPAGTISLLNIVDGDGTRDVGYLIQASPGTPTYTVTDPNVGVAQRWLIGLSLVSSPNTVTEGWLGSSDASGAAIPNSIYYFGPAEQNRPWLGQPPTNLYSGQLWPQPNLYKTLKTIYPF